MPGRMQAYRDPLAMLHYASSAAAAADGAPGAAGEDDELQSDAGQKRRCVWTEELHSRFEAAVESLGLDNAKPMAILDHMGVKGLTKANIKSHLQKYRLKVQAANKGGDSSGPNSGANGLRMLSAASRRPVPSAPSTLPSFHSTSSFGSSVGSRDGPLGPLSPRLAAGGSQHARGSTGHPGAGSCGSPGASMDTVLRADLPRLAGGPAGQTSHPFLSAHAGMRASMHAAANAANVRDKDRKAMGTKSWS